MATALVIDDDKAFRSKVKKLFKEIEVDVLEAEEAVQVIDILMRGKSGIDVIILDIQIAEIDGRDIRDIINGYAPNIPVIVSSVLPVSEQQLKIPRARDYYSKASADSVLVNKVKKILGIRVSV